MSVLLLKLSGHVFSIANFLLTLIFVSFILRSKKPPGNTWAWLLFIVVIPYVGMPIYIIFSGRKIGSKLQKKEKLFEPKAEGVPTAQDPVAQILDSSGAPPSRGNSEVQMLNSGLDAYPVMVELIESAKVSVSLSTFIFSNDSVGASILTLLIKKRNEGVAVRLLLDSLGSTWVKHPSFKELVKQGGQVGYFMPLIHLPFRGRANLRNHRKILVVDSQKAMLGGMNIANEYMGPTPDVQRWVDIGFKILGPSAGDLERIFAKDWKFATGEAMTEERIGKIDGAQSGSNQLRIVASGPDVVGDPLYDSLLTMIFKATKRVWVASPYFIPDESLAKALQLAAERGVDVRILIPQKSNHALADLARGTYLRQLADSGCKIQFLSKMIHAKAFLMDDSYALVGSANFDMRSLLYNFEVGAFITSAENLKPVETWFAKCLAGSTNAISKDSFWIDLAEGVGRVLGPLL